METGNVLCDTSSTPTTQQGLVVLFRQAPEGEPDLYGQTLQGHGLRSHSIPVLDFQYINIPDLAGHLQSSTDFSAIIFTSKRAVEATSQALQLLDGNLDVRTQCGNMRCYVVGPSTYKAAKEAGFCPEDTDAGNAEALADIITDSISSDSRPLLYPCGNLRRDTLSTKLVNAGLKLKECEVYKTVKHALIRENFLHFIHTQGLPEYVVYFSPSGVTNTEDLVTSDLLPLHKLKVIAIGPTTEKELTRRGISVHGVAARPDPKGLVEAMTSQRSSSDPASVD